MHHRCQDEPVDFLRWIHHIMEADDGHVPDPDHLVPVANTAHTRVRRADADHAAFDEILDHALVHQRGVARGTPENLADRLRGGQHVVIESDGARLAFLRQMETE